MIDIEYKPLSIIQKGPPAPNVGFSGEERWCTVNGNLYHYVKIGLVWHNTIFGSQSNNQNQEVQQLSIENQLGGVGQSDLIVDHLTVRQTISSSTDTISSHAIVTHPSDNSQAHQDYLLNEGSDVMRGSLRLTGYFNASATAEHLLYARSGGSSTDMLFVGNPDHSSGYSCVGIGVASAEVKGKFNIATQNDDSAFWVSLVEGKSNFGLEITSTVSDASGARINIYESDGGSIGLWQQEPSAGSLKKLNSISQSSSTWMDITDLDNVALAASNLNFNLSGNLILNDIYDGLHDGQNEQAIIPSHALWDVGSRANKFRSIFAEELIVETLVAQGILATIGGEIIVTPTTKLSVNLDSADETMYLEHNIFTVGDYILMKGSDPLGFPKTEYMKVVSVVDNNEEIFQSNGYWVGNQYAIPAAHIALHPELEGGRRILASTPTSGIYAGIPFDPQHLEKLYIGSSNADPIGEVTALIYLDGSNFPPANTFDCIEIEADEESHSGYDTPVYRGPFSVTVTRNLNGGTAWTWEKGDAVISYGGSAVGEGFIELSSTETTTQEIGPTISIRQRTSVTNYNDIREVAILGELKGRLDYSSRTTGLALGSDLTPGDMTGRTFITADAVNGLRLNNVPIVQYLNGVQRFNIKPTGDILLGADLGNTSKIYFRAFVNDTVHGEETYTSGDILLGSSGANNINLYIDRDTDDITEGSIKIRRGIIPIAQFNKDGSGALAGGNITWVQSGEGGTASDFELNINANVTFTNNPWYDVDQDSIDLDGFNSDSDFSNFSEWTSLISDLASTQEAADGVIHGYIQDGEPTAGESNFGDIWIDTDNSNYPSATHCIYRFEDTDQGHSGGLTWYSAQTSGHESIKDSAIGVTYLAAAQAQSIADGKISTWFQDADPSSGWTAEEKANNLGDLWIETDNNNKMSIFVYESAAYSWIDTTNTQLTNALSDVANLQEAADGEIKIFISDTLPQSSFSYGDIFINTVVLNFQFLNFSGTITAGAYDAIFRYQNDSGGFSPEDSLYEVMDWVSTPLSAIGIAWIDAYGSNQSQIFQQNLIESQNASLIPGNATSGGIGNMNFETQPPGAIVETYVTGDHGDIQIGLYGRVTGTLKYTNPRTNILTEIAVTTLGRSFLFYGLEGSDNSESVSMVDWGINTSASQSQYDPANVLENNFVNYYIAWTDGSWIEDAAIVSLIDGTALTDLSNSNTGLSNLNAHLLQVHYIPASMLNKTIKLRDFNVGTMADHVITASEINKWMAFDNYGALGLVDLDANDATIIAWAARDRIIAGEANGITSMGDFMTGNTEIELAQGTADGKQHIFYQAAEPVDGDAPAPPGVLETGDLWVDTNDGNKLYRYSGSGWVNIQDSDAVNGANAWDWVQTNEAVAMESGSNIFYQDSGSVPSGASSGDMWIKTDLGNQPWVYTGSGWVPAYTEIDGGYITTGQISANRIQTSSGTLSPFLPTDWGFLPTDTNNQWPTAHANGWDYQIRNYDSATDTWPTKSNSWDTNIQEDGNIGTGLNITLKAKGYGPYSTSSTMNTLRLRVPGVVDDGEGTMMQIWSPWVQLNPTVDYTVEYGEGKNDGDNRLHSDYFGVEITDAIDLGNGVLGPNVYSRADFNGQNLNCNYVAADGVVSDGGTNLYFNYMYNSVDTNNTHQQFRHVIFGENKTPDEMKNGGNIHEMLAYNDITHCTNMQFRKINQESSTGIFWRFRWLLYDGAGYGDAAGPVTRYISGFSVYPTAGGGSTVIDGGNIKTGHIEAIDIHSAGKTTYNSVTNGFFLGDTDKFGVGGANEYMTFSSGVLKIKGELDLEKISDCNPKILDSSNNLIPLFSRINVGDWAVNDFSSDTFYLGTLFARNGATGDVTVHADMSGSNNIVWMPRIQYRSSSSNSWIDVQHPAYDGSTEFLWAGGGDPLREFHGRYVWTIADSTMAVNSGKFYIRFVAGENGGVDGEGNTGSFQHVFISGLMSNGF